MVELIYMSQAYHDFSDADLKSLLSSARENNKANNITGMLLYDRLGTFIQAIEGEKQDIEALFQKISNDPRHGEIERLSYKEIDERSFSDWQMAFDSFEDVSLAIDSNTNLTKEVNTECSSQNYDEIVSTLKLVVEKLPSNTQHFAITLLNSFKNQALSPVPDNTRKTA
jgi:predicted sulfurtransferase